MVWAESQAPPVKIPVKKKNARMSIMGYHFQEASKYSKSSKPNGKYLIHDTCQAMKHDRLKCSLLFNVELDNFSEFED